jgi:hypothetical protein
MTTNPAPAPMALDGLKITLDGSPRGPTLVLRTGQYDTGRLAVFAMCEDGEPYGTLTVHLPDDPIEAGLIHVKTWGGNQPMAHGALASGAFEDTGKRVKTGHVEAQVWRVLATLPAGVTTLGSSRLLAVLAEYKIPTEQVTPFLLKMAEDHERRYGGMVNSGHGNVNKAECWRLLDTWLGVKTKADAPATITPREASEVIDALTSGDYDAVVVAFGGTVPEEPDYDCDDIPRFNIPEDPELAAILADLDEDAGPEGSDTPPLALPTPDGTKMP